MLLKDVKNSNFYENSKDFVPYSLVLNESHVSLIPHMTLISMPKPLTINGAITLFRVILKILR